MELMFECCKMLVPNRQEASEIGYNKDNVILE